MSTKKASQDATQNIDQVSSENAAASRFTVTAEFNFGQFLVQQSHEVSPEIYAKFANEGFKSISQNASSRLDSTKEFGNFGHTGPDGKVVKRPDGKDGRPEYKRGQVKFTPELAEAVRQFCATHTLANETVATTVSRYESSAVKAVTIDQAGLVIAKNAITKRNDNPTELDKLAKMVEFDYAATNELTVENAAFVEKVASFYANL